jgi:acyl-CoA synthetase (AMP-forming)/AMP-acid ligase II
MFGAGAGLGQDGDNIFQRLPRLVDEIVTLEDAITVPANLAGDENMASARGDAIGVTFGLGPAFRLQDAHASCADSRIVNELLACAKESRFLKKVVCFDGTSNHEAELDRVALGKPVLFDAVKTGRDDVALLGFTSGTTGEPKATMHFHRDLLIIARWLCARGVEHRSF